VVDLAFPLEGGIYLVVSGGSNTTVNSLLITLDASMLRFHAYPGPSYGVDVAKLDDWGFRANGLQLREPTAYDVYGTSVYAPCGGSVLIALDGLPGMQAPQLDREHMAGNHMLLRTRMLMCCWDTLSRGALPLQRATHLPWGAYRSRRKLRQHGRTPSSHSCAASRHAQRAAIGRTAAGAL
jgi:hypothetical protein